MKSKRKKPTKSELRKAVVDTLNVLAEARPVHLELARRMLEPGKTYLYALDFLALAVFKRSLCLIKGFTSAIRTKNFICAAPLLRLQIDNVLRFYATYLVSDPHKFVTKILEGERIDKQKDAKGMKLHDSYILENLPVRYQGLRKLYMTTSGYIHLSDEHIHNSITFKKGKIAGLVSEKDHLIGDNVRLEAVYSMAKTTEILLEMLGSWSNEKRRTFPG